MTSRVRVGVLLCFPELLEFIMGYLPAWIVVNHNYLPFGVFLEMLILKRIKGNYAFDTETR